MTVNDTLRYRDASAAVDDRVADLLARMTLDEKLAQLGSVWVFQVATGDGFDAGRAGPLLAHGIGHVTRLCGASSLTAEAAAALANDLQRHLLQNTRLGIPAIVHEEICAGLMAREATVYPQALGVAATFRPGLNRLLADAVRRQMRAIGTHQGLSPVLDICRDPRWGRIEETYGEDPYLASLMGMEFVAGLQGADDPAGLREGVVATAKHFVGYGASEGGLNWAPAHLPDRELRDVYLRPFEAVVRQAGLASVMHGYHELDGVPCAANRWLLTDVLRGEWGFDGTVVADYFAVKQLHEYHRVVADRPAAAVTALQAGLDVELPSTECYGDDLRGAVERGAVCEDVVDVAVARVLRTKFRLGLFESPFVPLDRVRSVTRTAEQIGLARRIAAESLVLLKNDGTLPIRPDVTSVAVIGPTAATARNMLGDYSYATHVESLVEILRTGDNVFAMPLDEGVDIDDRTSLDHVGTVYGELARALPDVDVSWSQGCGVNDGDRSGFDAAVAVAAASDLAVLVVGDRSGLTDDCTTGESRDVAHLSLPGVQEELVRAVAATGTPVVVVLVAGRPIGSPAVHDAASAVLMAWLPGEQGAAAVVDALVGATSPAGRLPVSFPRSSGQVPVFYAHKVSGGRSHWKGSYVDESNEPLYAFGHGLGYSTFDIVPRVPPSPVRRTVGESVQVVVEVANTGPVRADEVVQVYAHDPVASVTRPVRELVGFHRVTLDPGGCALVTFDIPVAALGFTGRDLHYAVETGEIHLLVGPSSDRLVPAGTVTVVGDGPVRTTRPTTNTVSVSTG